MLSIFNKKSEKFNKRFSDWILKMPSTIDIEIRAINIGILENPKGYSIYLIGSKVYDTENDDWACNEDFVPKNKYLKLTENESNNKDWNDIQSFILDEVKEFINGNHYEKSILNFVDHLTIGFDDGDLLKIK